MREFLTEMFGFNKEANIKMVSPVASLPSPVEGLKYLSHLANCQYKWLDRIILFPEESNLDWWVPEYTAEQLPNHFENSSQQWIDYLSEKSEDDLEEVKKYVGYDGTVWESKLKDIALQLIFHSFHHRAQIQMMIRAQGHKPAFIDYIGKKQKKTGTI